MMHNKLPYELQESLSKLDDPKKIREFSERNGECFYTLAQSLGIDKSKTVEPVISAKGKWDVRIKTNPVDDSKTVVLVLIADSGKHRRGELTALVLRCKSNDTNLYFIWHDYLGS